MLYMDYLQICGGVGHAWLLIMVVRIEQVSIESTCIVYGYGYILCTSHSCQLDIVNSDSARWTW